MAVEYTTIHAHHAGFGMYQTDANGWQVFGREYDPTSNDGVAEATTQDWLDWLDENLRNDYDDYRILRDTDETSAIDGNVYNQDGGEVIVVETERGGRTERIAYAVREVPAEAIA